MNRILQKRMWLAGASLLAIVLGSGEANAVVFGTPGGIEYIIPSTGYYDFTVAGANGGGLDDGLYPRRKWRGCGRRAFFNAGNILDIVVGGGGGEGYAVAGDGYAGGGGGGSFFSAPGLLFAAGGGGGVGWPG